MLVSLFSCAQPPDPMDREVIAMIELALARSGYAKGNAARDMGMSESQFSRELGTGQFCLRDLFKLTADFWNQLLPLLGQRYGLDVSSEDIAVRAMSDALEALGRVTKHMSMLRISHIKPRMARKERVS